VYEKIEVIRETTPRIITATQAMSLFQKCIVPHETPVAKKQNITARVRLKVTTCLYLKPSKRARSLSTLMAVDVKTDNPHKTKPVTM